MVLDSSMPFLQKTHFFCDTILYIGHPYSSVTTPFVYGLDTNTDIVHRNRTFRALQFVFIVKILQGALALLYRAYTLYTLQTHELFDNCLECREILAGSSYLHSSDLGLEWRYIYTYNTKKSI